MTTNYTIPATTLDRLWDSAVQGATLLDERVPDWWTRIVPLSLANSPFNVEGMLNMSSCTRCVLGVLYGEYDQGVVALRLRIDRDDIRSMGGVEADYGFTCRDRDIVEQGQPGDPYYPFTELGEMWLALARTRQSAAERQR